MVKSVADAEHPTIAPWYDLFSRGSRDWLRHNEKIREAVREQLPQVVANGTFRGGGARTVQVPVRMLEHAHFRLRGDGSASGAGQGKARPGDVLGQAQRPGGDPGRGPGGTDGGDIEFVLEFRVEDVVDWLWEELALPNLKARVGRAEQSDWIREGWDRRGAQSRLDRRRSLREAIKRRAIQHEGAPFVNDDLRFRQLARREQPSIQAAVFFVMDVSGSMTDEDRKLAKAFFFWVLQGLRRQYRHLDVVFVAHTDEAWQFTEEQFFQVTGTGGTVSSTAYCKVLELIAAHYAPERWNNYVFYASDGDNSVQDRDAAAAALGELAGCTNYLGYTEIARTPGARPPSEITQLYAALAAAGKAAGHFRLAEHADVFDAVRAFFTAGGAAGAEERS
jgi:hypothetical protein